MASEHPNSTSSAASSSDSLLPGSPLNHPPLATQTDEPADLSLIIGIVCVVGLIVVIAIFVSVVCRLCRSSHGNRALLTKGGAAVRSNGSSGQSNSNSNGVHHSPKSVEVTTYGNGGGVDPSRLLSVPSPMSGGYCLTNSRLCVDGSTMRKPVDVHTSFSGHGKPPVVLSRYPFHLDHFAQPLNSYFMWPIWEIFRKFVFLPVVLFRIRQGSSNVAAEYARSRSLSRLGVASHHAGHVESISCDRRL